MKLILLLILLPFLCNAQSCIPCEKLVDLKIPQVTILKAQRLDGDTIRYNDPFAPIVILKKSFCRVQARIDAEIKFELLMPQDWNGRFIMSGGGVFVGNTMNFNSSTVDNGYATAATDTGHEANPFSAEWAYNNMERQLNFGKLGVHRTAVISKVIMETYYCKQPSYSYFVGCSRGGGQGMIEAQYYPEDFDGIVAGAPAYSWPAIGAKVISICQKNYPNPKDLKPVLTADNLKLLQEFVLKQCDILDKVKDGIVGDPRDCKFDYSKIPMCSGDKPGPSCLTRGQLDVAKAVYEPLVKEGKVIYPGFPFGAEAEPFSWDITIAGTSPMMQPSFHFQVGTNMFKFLVFNDPSWDYSKYDFSNFYSQTSFASSFLDATQTDYAGLKKRDAKMILYHGWNDPVLSAYSTIEHYEAALQKDKDLSKNIRLFLLPGVLHCSGGPGCADVDWISLIQNWVENKQEPVVAMSSKAVDGKVVATKPVYNYPKVAIYKGTGDVSKDTSYGLKN
ncbi:MAG: tannase/feruloyl esterase family alpha/beta hydrolase [Chryseolinea sp.]